jgi:hypothetical protein
MASAVFMEDLLEDRGDVRADLFFQAVGEPGPDAAGELGHEGWHSFTRAISCWIASQVSLVRGSADGKAARLVAAKGMRRRREVR